MMRSNRYGWIGDGLLTFISLVFFLVIVPSLGFAEEIQYITPEALKELIESGDKSIQVVDTQPKSAYDRGHIKGAINFPWAMDIKSPGNLPRDKTLVLYCDCGHEEDAADLARQLMKKFGYKNIKFLEGGWSKWRQLGYPIDFK